jgi:hypothetical protein
LGVLEEETKEHDRYGAWECRGHGEGGRGGRIFVT